MISAALAAQLALQDLFALLLYQDFISLTDLAQHYPKIALLALSILLTVEFATVAFTW